MRCLERGMRGRIGILRRSKGGMSERIDVPVGHLRRIFA
jgi:hypothetical protein